MRQQNNGRRRQNRGSNRRNFNNGNLNGNNANLIWFDATSCPNLTCISVSDTAFMNSNLGNFIAIDPGAYFSDDCSLAASCSIDSIAVSVGTCDATSNEYSVSGNVYFNNPPSTGSLTVSNACGGSQVFNAPFTSPLAYNISNLQSNGASCSLTAVFSEDSLCTSIQPYNSPIPCLSSSITTQVKAVYCGTTVSSMGSNIYCNSVVGSTHYQYEVRIGGQVIQTMPPRQDNKFRFSWMSNEMYNTCYDLYVRWSNDGAQTFSPFGSVCNVCSPNLPTTRLGNSYCNQEGALFGSNIYAFTVPGATQYRFVFMDSLGVIIDTIDQN